MSNPGISDAITIIEKLLPRLEKRLKDLLDDSSTSMLIDSRGIGNLQTRIDQTQHIIRILREHQ